MTDNWRQIFIRPWSWLTRATYLAAFGILGFVLLPRAQNAIETYASWRTTSGRYNMQFDVLTQSDSLNNEFEALSSQLEYLSTGSSGRPDSTYFLATLQSKAEDAAVVLREVRPTAIDTLKGTRVTSISLQVDGQYHGLGNFVSLLESERIPYHAMTLSMRSTADSATFLSADLTIRAYSIVPSAAVRNP